MLARQVAVLGLALGLPGCRQLLGIDDPAVLSELCGDAACPGDAPDEASLDAPGDVASDASMLPVTLTFRVGCGDGTVTAHQLCQSMGYAQATAARGHGWWQCAGPEDRCPGGFVGLLCPDWCGASDCVGDPFCGSSHSVLQIAGDGATPWNALDYPQSSCVIGNPGWTIRATCAP